MLLLAVWQLSVSAGWLSTRLQPTPPTDDPAGIAASILDNELDLLVGYLKHMAGRKQQP